MFAMGRSWIRSDDCVHRRCIRLHRFLLCHYFAQHRCKSTVAGSWRSLHRPGMRTPQDSERCFVTLVWEVCNLNEWRLPRPTWKPHDTAVQVEAFWNAMRIACVVLGLVSQYVPASTVSAEESTSVSRGLPFPGTSSAQGLGYRLDSPKFLMIGKRRHLAVRFA